MSLLGFDGLRDIPKPQLLDTANSVLNFRNVKRLQKIIIRAEPDGQSQPAPRIRRSTSAGT